MFLSGDEFMDLFKETRKAIGKAYKSFSNTKQWPLTDDQLYTENAEKFGTSEVGKAGKLLQQWFKDQRQSALLKYNPGCHWLRKMYVNYSYQMFDGARTKKDVAHACDVLGHASISVSMNYTNMIIKMTVRPGKEFDSLLSSKITELQNQLQELVGKYQTLSGQTDVIDLKAEDGSTHSVRKLRLGRFSPAQKQNNDDVSEVMNHISKWSDVGIKPTLDNLRSVGIGSALASKVKAYIEKNM